VTSKLIKRYVLSFFRLFHKQVSLNAAI